MDKRLYNRQYYYKRRARIIKALGGKCAVCGLRTDLHVDHVDRRKKTFNIGTNLSSPRMGDELRNCQLLCRKHHEQKTSRENAGFTHGTVYAWMKRKCGCDACGTAKRQWHDQRNAGRRVRRQPNRRKSDSNSLLVVKK